MNPMWPRELRVHSQYVVRNTRPGDVEIEIADEHGQVVLTITTSRENAAKYLPGTPVFITLRTSE